MSYHNAKNLICTVTAPTGSRLEVYLVNPGDGFVGFGGSSAALPVTKTASLITREVGNHGCYDHEYNLNDPQAWLHIVKAIRDPQNTVTTKE